MEARSLQLLFHPSASATLIVGRLSVASRAGPNSLFDESRLLIIVGDQTRIIADARVENRAARSIRQLTAKRNTTSRGTTMRAAWYEKHGSARDVLVVGEMIDPEPTDGEVRIRLAVSGINPGDMKKRSGWQGAPMRYARVIPHSDGAGVIDAVGAGVSPDRIGQHVWCWRPILSAVRDGGRVGCGACGVRSALAILGAQCERSGPGRAGRMSGDRRYHRA